MTEEPPMDEQSVIRLTELRRDVEALLFASGDPLTIEGIMQALGHTDVTVRRAIEQVLAQLQAEFPPEGERGFELARLGGGWVFRTNPLCEGAVKSLFEIPMESGRLSPASMECLAIVAYLQPVSRPQISEIRGVNSDSPIRNLLDRELIQDVGRSQSRGGATLYATTARFEVMFGLASITDLPPVEDFDLTDEARADLRQRLGLLTVPE